MTARADETTPALPSQSQTWRARLREAWSLDLRSLAALRVLLGVILIVDLFDRARDMTAHYTDAGMLPLASLEGWHEPLSSLSLHTLSGAAWWQWSLWGVGLAVAVAFLVGWRTRLMTVLGWLFLMSLHTRNPLLLTRGDIIFRLLFFWCMWLPLGARVSVDAWVARRRGTVEEEMEHAGIGSVGYLVQLGAIYVFSVFFKTDPIWREEGTALYYALSLDHYTTWFGKAMLEHQRTLVFGTFATLVIEAFSPLLAVIPWRHHLMRYAAIGSFWALHLGILACMKIGIFTFVMLSAWVALLPAHFWDNLPDRLRAWWGERAARVEAALAGRALAVERWTGSGAAVWGARWRAGGVVWRGLGVSALALVCWWNVASVHDEVELPEAVRGVGEQLQLRQKWSMFAPYPDRNDGWFVITGHLRDGAQVNLFRPGEPIPRNKPASVSSIYPNMRWRRTMYRLQLGEHAARRAEYAAYLCRDWNARHDHARGLVRVELVFMLEFTTPPGEAPTIDAIPTLDFDCATGEPLSQTEFLF